MQFRANPVATLFPLLLAGFLAGMSYWLELASRPPKVGNDGKSRHDPDYIVENFNVRRFDAEGLLQHTLIADRMRHFPDDDTTLIAEPRLIYHRVPATYINARQALVDGKGEHVELSQDVRVLRAGLNGKPATEMHTERLDAFPDDEIARSSVPVKIVQGLSHIAGNTLESNNKAATHILDGAVKGTFYRNRLAAATALPPQAKPPLPVTRKPVVRALPQVKPAAKPKPQAKSPSRPKSPAKPQPKPKR